MSQNRYSLKHEASGQLWPVTEKGFLIGRDKADVKFLSDDKLSRNHCRVFVDHLGFVSVEDLGSTNKTWVNEVAIEAQSPVRLKKGDVLRVGHQNFSLHEEQEAAHKPVPKKSLLKRKAAEPTILASRDAKTMRMEINPNRRKNIILWAILIVVGTLLVLMFLFPDEANSLIQSLA